ATPSTAAAAPAAPVELGRGRLRGIDHRATGEAALYRLGDGAHLVRLEEIDLQNGPDLFVYLVPEPGQQTEAGAVNLGKLKGNKGSQNYEVPADVDPGAYSTVLIWCRAFAVPFANAVVR
ncbi:MAG: DM13 domain-containing protein, partial [Acidimicrobiales bacterium]